VEKNLGAFDILKGALAYPFSDRGSFFIGGLVTILYFFYIGIPFILGYQTRCARHLFRGEEYLPGWGDIGDLIKDGIMTFVISLVYGLAISAVVFVFYIPLIVVALLYGGDGNTMPYWVLALMLLLVLAMFVVVIPLSMLLWISWMIYADTSDLGRAINPLNAAKLLRERPLDFVLGLVLQFIVSFIISIPILVLYVLAIVSMLVSEYAVCLVFPLLMIILPWIVFPTLVSMAYIFARCYQRATGKVSPGPTGTV
jgi:hypothetical protein